MRALILGGGGQLASDLHSLIGDGARSYNHAQCDICNEDDVERAYDETRPEIVFNCAAFHNVDACELQHEQAWRVNVEAVRQLAVRKVPLVHVSTNYVFDGKQAAPYGEDQAPSPRSVYAITKLAGEYAAVAYGEQTLIVRTAGLYGMHGSESKGGNFVQRMLARAREQGSLRMVADQRLQPTFTADLARAIFDAVALGATGVIHLTAAGSCSWFEFTEKIIQIAGFDIPIEPVATQAPAEGPERPLNGVLARPRADQFGIPQLRPWADGLLDYMSRSGVAADVSQSQARAS